MSGKNGQKAVALWLISGVVMIIIQTLLGGVTRLTGSGLSITEWKPIMGMLPPLNEQEWNRAFEGYKHIGQYKLLNSNFTIGDFKAIFFWEWFHRLWARMLFVVFAIGFCYFLYTKRLTKTMIRPFLILLVLGALQGLIGWLMVATGLNSTDIHVHYMALAIHFIAAMGLACYTLWFALTLLIPSEQRSANVGAFRFTLLLLLLTVAQLVYGAFMSGLKAAAAAPTWPLINGTYFPNTLGTNGLVKDTDLGALDLNVQFIHRNLAYVLVCLTLVWYISLKRTVQAEKAISTAMKYPLLLITLQVVLGIATVLNATGIIPGKFGPFETLAECHQLTAMFYLMSLLTCLYTLSAKQK